MHYKASKPKILGDNFSIFWIEQYAAKGPRFSLLLFLGRPTLVGKALSLTHELFLFFINPPRSAAKQWAAMASNVFRKFSRR